MALGLGIWNNLEANMKMDRAICRDWADVSQEFQMPNPTTTSVQSYQKLYQ